MAYEQAQIAVQKTEDFEQLRSAIERIFASVALEKFYSRLESKGVSAREFEKIAGLGLLEQADADLARRGKSAKDLYQSLTLSDQAQMREFYLERMEKVDPQIRLKYQKVYRYY
jgi:predicted RNA binding protein with dsRBD fold (UPF0201 family)